MKNFLICLVSFSLLIYGCATRHFVIKSNPEGALILQNFGEIGMAPTDYKVTFAGKSHRRHLTALKRGYAPDTIIITKESPLEINFNLNKIEGVSPIIKKYTDLTVNNVNLLPVNVEIILHKGIGNLDKYERSDELSDHAYDRLNQELNGIESDTTISLITFPADQSITWIPVLNTLEKYLKSLKPGLLIYYPEPPSIQNVMLGNHELFSMVLDSLVSSDSKQYLIFAWCRSIKTTTGRLIGNAALAVASGVVAGYERAVHGFPVSYYDPSGFNMDNHTLFVTYIIHPESGEVIDIKQHVVPYEITKAEYLQRFAKSIITFPKIQQKPQ